MLERAVEAAGGREAIELPQRVHSRSRVVLHPRAGVTLEGELTYWAEGSARERRELVTHDGHRLVQIVNGDRSFEMQDGVPTGRDLAIESKVRRRYRRLLGDLADDPSQVELIVDPQADPDRELVLERRYEPNERWQLWLDARTLVATRIRRLVDDPSGAHVFEDRLDGHERVGARVLPRRQITWHDGVRLKESWLLEHDDAPLLDPALFELDAH